MNFEWVTIGAALVVGGALATAGTVLQTVMRNPLAEPYMLGLVGGASLCAALAIRLGWAACGGGLLPVCAFAGACGALMLVGAVTRLAGRARLQDGADAALRTSKQTFVLAGFVTGSFTGSLQMLVLSGAPPDTFAAFSHWLFGDLRAVAAGPLLAGGAVFAGVWSYLRSRATLLDLYELGSDEMACLGVDTRRLTGGIVVAVSILTALAVALAGAIGFVGLVAPHVARRLTDGRHRRLLPLAAVIGGVTLLAAEGLGRCLPGGLSAGVVMAVCGAPFFFFLLCTTRPD